MNMKFIKGSLFLAVLALTFSSCNDDADPAIGGFDVYGLVEEHPDLSLTYQMSGEGTVYDADVTSMVVSSESSFYTYPMEVVDLGSDVYGYFNSEEQSYPFSSDSYTLDVTLGDGTILSTTDTYTNDYLDPCTNMSASYSDTLGGAIAIQFDQNLGADAYSFVITDTLGQIYAQTYEMTLQPDEGESVININIVYDYTGWNSSPATGENIVVTLRAISYTESGGYLVGYSNFALNTREVVWGVVDPTKAIKLGTALELKKE